MALRTLVLMRLVSLTHTMAPTCLHPTLMAFPFPSQDQRLGHFENAANHRRFLPSNRDLSAWYAPSLPVEAAARQGCRLENQREIPCFLFYHSFKVARQNKNRYSCNLRGFAEAILRIAERERPHQQVRNASPRIHECLFLFCLCLSFHLFQ